MQIHSLQGYIQNIFLVEDGTQLMLLDGCSRADVRMVCDYITRTLKRPLSDLKVIVVTHMHPDHAGGAHKLRNITGARLFAHPKAARWYSGVSGRTAHFIDVLLTYWVASRMGKPKAHIWYNPILSPDETLQDGQRIPGFPHWRVVYSSGHTDHDISLLHEPTHQIYVADLMVMVRKKIVPPYPICHPNQYRASLQRIAELNAEKVFCAHLPARASSEIPFDELLALAPESPKTHWYSAKNRISQKLGWQTQKH